MLETLYLSRQPADIFHKTKEKNTINYLSKAYSFVMNIFLNTAKQVDFLLFAKTINNVSPSNKYDSAIPTVLKREAETLIESIII